jgi:hypothetical protein
VVNVGDHRDIADTFDRLDFCTFSHFLRLFWLLYPLLT